MSQFTSQSNCKNNFSFYFFNHLCSNKFCLKKIKLSQWRFIENSLIFFFFFVSKRVSQLKEKNHKSEQVFCPLLVLIFSNFCMTECQKMRFQRPCIFSVLCLLIWNLMFHFFSNFSLNLIISLNPTNIIAKCILQTHIWWGRNWSGIRRRKTDEGQVTKCSDNFTDVCWFVLFLFFHISRLTLVL